jgi:hyaluronate lyase
VRRRTFLTLSTAAAAATTLNLPTASAAAPADFAALRAKWAADLTGRDVIDPADPDFKAALGRIDAAVASSLTKLDRSADRKLVFTDQPLTADPSVANTYVRLEQMATAWSTPGSAYHQAPALLADVLAALESMNTLIYRAGTVEFGNWWSWEIGATRPLASTMVLLYDEIPAEARARYCAAIDHFVPDPYYMFPPARRALSTGANRVDLCQAIIVRALVTDDEAKLVHARDGLSDTWQYVTTGDGFYRDGSFVQHTWVAYTGTYGHVLLSGIGKLLALLAGSPWEVTDPKRQILFDSVAKAYLPVVHDLRMTDFVRGRAVSRSNASDHDDGYTAAEAILRLAGGVDATLAARWRSAVAGWVRRDTYGNMLTGATIPRVALVKSLAGVTPAAEPDGHTLFASMDRSIHRRGGWAYAISMASRRIAYYEAGNGENDHGYHTGSGMTYLYDRDNGQYADAFWPTVDRYRLPGITVDKLPLPAKAGGEWGAARPAGATWVGGSTLGGYAAVGQDLEGPSSPLRARKSWFCFDEYIVALGAGITGSSGHAVETVVENRNLHAGGTNKLVVDGFVKVPALGDTADIPRARWAHLEGVAGYVFLSAGAALRALREERTGSWRDINTGGSPTPITRRYLTLWVDHGVDPTNASYAYLLAPGASVARTQQLARSSTLRVLANTADVQAVTHSGLTLASFWRAGRAGNLFADNPLSVIQRVRGRDIEIALSDPTQLATTIRLRVVLPGARVVQTDEGLTTRRTPLGVEITADVQGAAGASRVVKLRLG